MFCKRGRGKGGSEGKLRRKCVQESRNGVEDSGSSRSDKDTDNSC